MTTASPAARTAAAPSQAPVIVTWQKRLLGPLHLFGVFWYRIHVWAVSWLPRPLIAVLMPAFALGFTCALPGVRRALERNLARVLGVTRSPVQGWLRAWRTIHNHAWCLTESYEALAGVRANQVSLEGEEHWHALNLGESGFVVVTAHVGHWELGSRDREVTSARRVNVVREREVDPRAQDFLSSLLRRRGGDRVVFHFTSTHDVDLGPRLLLALRGGELVAIQGDRPRAGGRCVEVGLFGERLLLPVGPAALARAAAVPLLPVFALRNGRSRTLVVIRPPIHVAHTEQRSQDLERAVAQLACEIEAIIRRQPHQWFCFRDLWGPHARQRAGSHAEPENVQPSAR